MIDMNSLINQHRAKRSDCVCSKGNVHSSSERANFLNWLYPMIEKYGASIQDWPIVAKTQYKKHYIPSH